MAQPNRETVRDQLATLLTAQLVTADSVVQAVYNYRIGDFAGLSPVVTVSSGGSNREQITMGKVGVRQAIFYLTVHIFVLYAATGWTEAQAEDRLDRIERGIADVIDANSGKTSYWNELDWQGDTTRDDVVIGGDDYIRETIPIGVGALYG